MQTAPARQTADEFLVWAMDRPEGLRWELVQGEPIAMATERAAHARAKLRIAARLNAAEQSAGLQCEVFGDGMAVVVDESTVHEPDVLLRCGEPLPDEAVKVTDPLIVVEVVPLLPDHATPASNSRTISASPLCGTTSSFARLIAL